VRHLAGECGIRQFLDIGTGLPAPASAHQVAQAIAPGSRVVYVDNDPLVLVHARALLTSGPQGCCDYVGADLRDTPAVLAGAARTLDFARPVAVLLLAVLHFLPGADDPAGVVAALARPLAPGSVVVISHLTADFGALPLVPPGVVPITEWRPPTGPSPQTVDLYAGVARKPEGRIRVQAVLKG
jgi:SAM-dependent methyltransferase